MLISGVIFAICACIVFLLIAMKSFSTSLLVQVVIVDFINLMLFCLLCLYGFMTNEWLVFLLCTVMQLFVFIFPYIVLKIMNDKHDN